MKYGIIIYCDEGHKEVQTNDYSIAWDLYHYFCDTLSSNARVCILDYDTAEVFQSNKEISD